MEVGIITIHNHYNYGAALQAFALNYTVRGLGHLCKTIDCNIEPAKCRSFKWSTHPGVLITSLYNFSRFRANKLHERKFRDFVKQYIPMTDSSYETLEQLVSSPPEFDAYITGSDQVWNPYKIEQEIGGAYHLCFASPEKSRLIAYAPSFGLSEIPERYKKTIEEYLMRYQFLSVREKKGQEIIFDLTGRKAEHVLDPTLLLTADEYESIIQFPSIPKEYILVYPIELGEKMNFFNLVKEVKKQVSLPVVCLLPLNFDFRWLLIADRVILDVGPQEFLGLFKNSSIVCTNSFHGTVFSIVYNKSFLGTPKLITNSRTYSLLEIVGLLKRQIENVNTQNVQNALKVSIDYSVVNQLLRASIEKSKTYLKKALDA
jgi:hypothetical protein